MEIYHLLLVHSEASRLETTPKSYDFGLFSKDDIPHFANGMEEMHVKMTQHSADNLLPNVHTAWGSEDYVLLCVPIDESKPVVSYANGFHPLDYDPRK